ncbi:MAG: NAD(P)H-dependent flavin oxidoreductase [Burkholderiales bacterium]
MQTKFTDAFDLIYPIALAPMGAVSGGALAAAVSNAGALGLIGGGYGDSAWLKRELDIVATKARGRWGVGLITWHACVDAVKLALSYKPQAFFLSFGDPSPYVDLIKAQGCMLICQVQDLTAARTAKAVGADFVVAQGAEAGGHGATRGTLPLVPAVIDCVHPTPVLAAGGIADGRGLAAALALGAQGAVIGTRYCATPEALVNPKAVDRLLRATGDDTVRTRVFDIGRGYDWPKGFTGRALRNRFSAQWHGKEDALASDASAISTYQRAAQDANFDIALVWGGEAVDLISAVEPAGPLTERIGRDAEARLRRLAQR